MPSVGHAVDGKAAGLLRYRTVAHIDDDALLFFDADESAGDTTP